MRRDPRTNMALIVSALFLLIVMSTGEAAVMVPLGIMLALILLVRRPAVDERSTRADRELRARAEYEHHALMLGHDAVGIYGRFQPTPLEPVREELLPEHLRSAPDPAAPTRATPTPATQAPPLQEPSTEPPLAETPHVQTSHAQTSHAQTSHAQTSHAEAPPPPANRPDAHPTDPSGHDDGPRRTLDSTSLHWVPRTHRPQRDSVVPDTAGPDTPTSRPIERETPG